MSESVMTRVEDDNVSHAPATVMPDRVGLAEDIVISSLPDVDRQIHELKTGRKGEPMQNKDIAAMLKISPARVSQRSKNIADQINMLVTKGWV
jgi:DNA-directed RNA polymerase specialized sigma subunit